MFIYPNYAFLIKIKATICVIIILGDNMKVSDELQKIEIKDDLKVVDINGHYEYATDSSLVRAMNDFFQSADEAYSLIAHSSIASMNQVVVSTTEKPIIGTQGLDTCFGILFYDRKNRFGICGHADPKNIFGIVKEMLNQIPPNTEGAIEYTIIPGYRALEQCNFMAIDEILDILQSYSSINPKISFMALNSSLNPSTPNNLLCFDFAFDTKSGRCVTDMVFANISKEQNRRHI